jgi:hypothetical protein
VWSLGLIWEKSLKGMPLDGHWIWCLRHADLRPGQLLSAPSRRPNIHVLFPVASAPPQEPSKWSPR